MTFVYFLFVGLWCLTPFQQYFSYIVVVSFIFGGNRSIRRKPAICRKLLTIFITLCCIEYTSPWMGLELTTLIMIISLIALVVIHSTIIRSRPRRNDISCKLWYTFYCGLFKIYYIKCSLSVCSICMLLCSICPEYAFIARLCLNKNNDL